MIQSRQIFSLRCSDKRRKRIGWNGASGVVECHLDLKISAQLLLLVSLSLSDDDVRAGHTTHASLEPTVLS